MSDNSKIASFRFLNYIVEESSLSISGSISSTNMEINLDLGLTVNRDTSTNKLTIAAEIKDENEIFFMKVKIAGYFDDKDCSDEQRNKFLCFNAPAILFPYLRAFVSSVTGQAGIAQVIIPTINLLPDGQKLLESLEKDFSNDQAEN